MAIVQKILNRVDGDSKEMLVKGFWSLALKVLGAGLGFLFTYIVAKQFGATVNGAVSLSFVVLYLFSLLGRVGLDIHFVKLFSQGNISKEEAKAVYFKSLVMFVMLSLVLATIAYLLAPAMAQHLFKKPELTAFFQWTALTIPTWTVTRVNGGVLRGNKRNAAFTFFYNTGNYLFALVILGIYVLAGFDDGLLPIKAYAIGSVITVLLSFWQVFKVLPRHTAKSTTITLSEVVKQSLPQMVSTSVFLFLGWTDTLMLGALGESTATAGIYNVALKLVAMASFVIEAVNSILAPKIAEAYHSGTHQSFKNLVQRSSMMVFLASFPLLIPFFAAPEFILSFFGNEGEFVVGATVLIILGLGHLFNISTGSVGVIMQMTGHQKQFMIIIAIALLFNIVGNALAIPVFGMEGGAVCSVLGLVIWKATGVIYIKKKLKVLTVIQPHKFKK